jgi:colanic acid/amylovoran biosynthesis glycosyltransferase
MKRVIFFVPEFPRLTETFIEREISKIIEFGNLDVRVVSLKKASGSMSAAVSTVTFYHRLDVITLLKSLEYLFNRNRQVIEAWKIVSRDKTKNFIQNLYFFIKALGYTKVFERHGPDHIHAHFLSDPSTYGLAASIILDVPFSVSGHALDVFVDGTLVKEKADRAEFITICNKAAWEKCRELSDEATHNKIFLMYHGVEVEEVLKGNNDEHTSDRPLIFTPARLVEKKGLKYLIEASELLKNRGVDHEIHIAGPGPLYDSLTEKISDLGLENNVFIEGGGEGIPFEQISSFYQKADIFALPSINTEEGDADGVPTVVIEASLAKLPIVTTDAGSITDLVTDKETGLIVPQKDPQALAVAIEKLIFDVNARRRIGESAHLKAKEMFDIDSNVGKLEKLLLS